MYSKNDIDNSVLAKALSVMEGADKMFVEDYLLITKWHEWLHDQASEVRSVAAFVATLDTASVTAAPLLFAVASLLDITAQAELGEKKGDIQPLLQMATHLRRAVEIGNDLPPF